MSEGIGTFTKEFFYEALLAHFGARGYQFNISDSEDRVRIDGVLVDGEEMEGGWLADLALELKRASLIPPFIARYYRMTPHLDVGSWTEVPYDTGEAASEALEELLTTQRGVCRIYGELAIRPEEPLWDVEAAARAGTLYVHPSEAMEARMLAVESAVGLYPFRSVAFGVNDDYVDVGQISADHADLEAAINAYRDYFKAGAKIAAVYVCTRQEIRNLD